MQVNLLKEIMMDFAKKVVLVTGANKGIGFETSRQLAAQEYTVLIGAREEGRGREAESELRKQGADVRFIKLDVTSAIDRAAVVAFITKNFGRLDALINNAGTILDRGVKPSEVTTDVLRQTFEINFFSVIALTQQLLPLIRKSDAGRIVNLSSNLASLTLHSEPESSIFDVTFLAYDASKTALNAFTVHLAHELRETPIKVNAAHPGWVKTTMGGDEAPMDVVDGAKTSVYLATLPADGPTGGFFHLQESIPW
jgi:NAD(P)-dependent dehydrogenase (short-subunit alcohol dehydrogenase family)